MRPLRLLHVTPYCGEAWAYGGIPRVVDATVAGLVERGHEVTVCTTDACDSSSRLRGRPRTFRAWPESVENGVALRVFPNISNRAAYHAQLFVPLGLRQYLHRHAKEFDVAHLHACRNMPGVIAASCLDAAGVPYVLAPNGTAPIIERRRLAKRAFDRVFGRRMLTGAARVIAVTEAERRQLLRLGVPDDRVSIVPNAIDLREFSTPLPRGLFRPASIPGSAPLVMFLGKLTPRKRLDVLIRAFATLPDASADRAAAWLVIAGNDMGSEDEARSLVRSLGLEHRTLFAGLLRGRRRLEALADADVVVYPSEDEIFGLVPLEALLVGTPVIVAGDSGCGEVVSRVSGGPVVQSGDVGALAVALRHVLGDESHWRGAAAAAAVRVRAHYGQAPVCAALEEVYFELADGRRTQARSSGMRPVLARTLPMDAGRVLVDPSEPIE